MPTVHGFPVTVTTSHPDIGEIEAECIVHGFWSHPTRHEPGEDPEVKIETLTSFDEDGEPIDCEHSVLDQLKVGSFKLRSHIEELALERWREEDDVGR